MKVSIIIPNHNGADLLKKNLPSVIEAAHYYQDATSNDIEIIIVDDASDDASEQVLTEFTKKNKLVSYAIQKENKGFSFTVNKGVAISRGDIVVLLNTDVSPSKDFLVHLLIHFKDEKVFAVGAMDKSIENGKEVLRGRGIGKWHRGFFIHAAGKLNKVNTLWVAGGSGAFDRGKWDMLGGLDELLNPFYWEDIDISYRALKSGFTTIFESKSIVVHDHEKGAIKSKYKPGQIEKVAYRNQFIFIWKNADKSTLFSHVLWLPIHFFKALLRLDCNFFSGFFAAILHMPKILKERKKVRRYFIYSDYDIISQYQE